MTSFSRAHPSPRYREHLQMNRHLHEQGDALYGIPPGQVFPGYSLLSLLEVLKPLLLLKTPQTLLDYGAGKGLQYHPELVLKGADGTPIPLRDAAGNIYKNVRDFLSIASITCYDPACAPHAALPEGTFDAVISTDVMEHCPQEDLPWIVEELFSFARQLVFVSIAGYPAIKTLPNGENAHITLKPMAWWEQLFAETAARHPGVDYLAVYETKTPDAGGHIEKTRQFFGSPGLLDTLMLPASGGGS